MNIHDLTVEQLRRAAAIKEQIDDLNKELNDMLGGSNNSGAVSTKSRPMSATVRKKIAAAQKARWANLRRANVGARSAKATPQAAKKKNGSCTPS